MTSKIWKVEMVIIDSYLDGDEEMDASMMADEIRNNWDRSAGLDIKELKVGLVTKDS